jgi:hypothetical protein
MALLDHCHCSCLVLHLFSGGLVDLCLPIPQLCWCLYFNVLYVGHCLSNFCDNCLSPVWLLFRSPHLSTAWALPAIWPTPPIFTSRVSKFAWLAEPNGFRIIGAFLTGFGPARARVNGRRNYHEIGKRGCAAGGNHGEWVGVVEP